MFHVKRRVDLQLHVGSAEAVFIGSVGHVVPGGEVLRLDPRQPGRRHSARRRTARLDLLRRFEDFRPGLRRVVDVQARLLKSVLVVIKDGRGGVVRKGQHRSVRLRIIGDDPGQILRFVEGEAALLEDLRCRHDRALGGHHRAAAGIEHLNNRRRLLRPESRDTGIQCLGIGALEHRHHLVGALALVELLGEFLDHFVIGTRHCVPPLQFRGGLRLKSEAECNRRGNGNQPHNILLPCTQPHPRRSPTLPMSSKRLVFLSTASFLESRLIRRQKQQQIKVL